jgi:nitrogen fixation protein FixH
MAKSMQIVSKPREFTGRAALIWLVGFFVVIIGVNATMIRLASTTFGGVETASSYKAGLAFKHDIEAAAQQDELHWKVDGTVTRAKSGEVTLDIKVRDSAGQVVPGWTATALLSHPLDSRLDQRLTVTRTGPDSARGVVYAEPGHWNVLIDIDRNGLRMFRSRSRLVIR